LFDFDRFHSTFHFYEDHEDRYMLTDAMEIHFLEYPKFQKTTKDLNDPLHRWMLFLDEKLPEDQLKELTIMDPVIRKTEERLEWLSADEETRRLYEAREHSLIERNSLKAEGWAEGRVEALIEVARNLLRKGNDPVEIADTTGLSVEDVESLLKDEKGKQ
jgi:predicted transposase/invertase (TIGR01784 family)